MKIKPFLRWAGGKQNLVDDLLKNTPNDNLINRYFEPFLGAGSLFFANGFSNALISDINPQLVNSYTQIKLNYVKVFNLLQKYDRKFKENKNYYYQLRDLFNKDKNRTNYIQAARFIFLIHSNYNGIYRVNKKGGYNVPLGRTNPFIPSFNQLQAISKKLQGIAIENFSYDQISSKVNGGDFIYLDPPYPPFEWTSPQNQYTVNHFTKEDHESLSEFAIKLNSLGCYVLISYPDIKYIREIYGDWNIIKLDTFRSISCKKERKKISELIIKNY